MELRVIVNAHRELFIVVDLVRERYVVQRLAGLAAEVYAF
jgi:hypothetical protein